MRSNSDRRSLFRGGQRLTLLDYVGRERTTTVRAYTPDEFSKLAADTPTM